MCLRVIKKLRNTSGASAYSFCTCIFNYLGVHEEKMCEQLKGFQNSQNLYEGKFCNQI